jgi:hypothetical protein
VSPFKTFKSFKSFNPPPLVLPRVAGEDEGEGLNGASFENLRTLTDSTLLTVTLRAFERVSRVEGKRLNVWNHWNRNYFELNLLNA